MTGAQGNRTAAAAAGRRFAVCVGIGGAGAGLSYRGSSTNRLMPRAVRVR
jgi:hypothetical protein